MFQNNSSLSLCNNRIFDHDYNFTAHIYTQNGSISHLRYGNYSIELILLYEMQYFMNVTIECCGSTVTLANFNFQFTKCINPKSHPDENISVMLYFDCNHKAYNYVCTKVKHTIVSGKWN